MTESEPVCWSFLFFKSARENKNLEYFVVLLQYYLYCSLDLLDWIYWILDLLKAWKIKKIKIKAKNKWDRLTNDVMFLLINVGKVNQSKAKAGDNSWLTKNKQIKKPNNTVTVKIVCAPYKDLERQKEYFCGFDFF